MEGKILEHLFRERPQLHSIVATKNLLSVYTLIFMSRKTHSFIHIYHLHRLRLQCADVGGVPMILQVHDVRFVEYLNEV